MSVINVFNDHYTIKELKTRFFYALLGNVNLHFSTQEIKNRKL